MEDASVPARLEADLDSVNKRNAWKILPFLVLGYVLNTLDKSNIGFASLEMNKALGFTAEVFGFGAGLFFVTYAFLEVPSNLLMRRVGPRRWLARILVTWGLLAMAMALTYDKTSFYVLRLLLGAAEAGWYPGVLFYLAAWFPQSFRARAVMLFWIGAPLSAVIGGPLSGLLLSLPPVAGVANWQWLFIIEGLPSVLLGFVVLRILKDSPREAGWLSAGERNALLRTLEREHPAGGPGHGRLADALNGRVVLFSAVNLLQGIGLYGTLIWVPRLIKDFGGLSNLEVGLLAAIPYVFAALGLAACAWSSDRFQDRKWHVFVSFAVGACALSATAASASPVVAMICLTIGIMGVIGAQGPFFALVIEGVRERGGPGATAAGLAIVTTCANLGGFIGPYGIGLALSAFGSFAYALLAMAGLFLLAGVLVAACVRGGRVQPAALGARA